jgi:pimeloyl-ACP methyl ester carboxylesterase
MRIRINGVSLFFEVEGTKLVQQGTDLLPRPTVVALHGGPGVDHATNRPYLSLLGNIAQVIHLDQRGNGRSDLSTPDCWNLETWADDVRAFCDALEIEAPIVLGTSFGGLVAQAYATRYPAHPRKLILCSTNPRFDLGRCLTMFQRLGGTSAMETAREFFTDVTPERLQRYIDICLPLYNRLPIRTPSPAPIERREVARHFVRGEWHTFDFTQALARIRCPTLVLAGAYDPVLPIEGSEELVAAIPPGLASLQRFEECGHNLLAEQPERTIATIAAFLREGWS